MSVRRSHAPLEKVEQAHILQLIASVGGTAYVLGTRRPKGDYQGTRQTPGVPDVIAFVPKPTMRGHGMQIALFIEVKRSVGGRLSPEQSAFRDHCRFSGQEHVVGGLNAVIAWMVQNGVITDRQVPHYRLSAHLQRSTM